MELWLLSAGAILLIGITLWLVWPARTADTLESTVSGEEVFKKPMTESDRISMPPQGDTFEDQYTSATADLSAGGVATAFESMPDTPRRSDVWPEAPATGERIGQASQCDNFPYTSPASGETHALVRPRTIGISAGALMTLGGAVGGAWLYSRWQRERNKPINRLRRGARHVATRLGDRIPEVVDDLPRGAAPMSGVATALLVSSLVASRAMRRDSDDRTEMLRDRGMELMRDSMREAMDRGREAMDRNRDVMKRGRHVVDRGREAMDRNRDVMKRGRYVMDRGREAMDRNRDVMKRGREVIGRTHFEGIEPRKPAVMGIGFGGLAIVAAGSYVIWRLIRGSDSRPEQPTWYAGQ